MVGGKKNQEESPRRRKACPGRAKERKTDWCRVEMEDGGIGTGRKKHGLLRKKTKTGELGVGATQLCKKGDVVVENQQEENEDEMKTHERMEKGEGCENEKYGPRVTEVLLDAEREGGLVQ